MIFQSGKILCAVFSDYIFIFQSFYKNVGLNIIPSCVTLRIWCALSAATLDSNTIAASTTTVATLPFVISFA